MDLDRDTLATLDWPVLVDALAERARTTLGRDAVLSLQPLQSGADIHRAFDLIDELARLQADRRDPPVGAVTDIRSVTIRASKGEILDPGDLRRAGDCLGALRDLAWFLARVQDDAPLLGSIADHILVDDALADELLVAFDNTGQLSARTYPELGDLRRRIQELHTTIRETLQALLTSDSMEDLLQDQFVTQRNDRYVLPIKSHAKRWDLGIVHGTSGSGQTVFVEPREVVELNNRLRLAEGELEVAERRILIRLSAGLGARLGPVSAAMDAVAGLDLTCARRALAEDLRACRPEVGSSGVVDLRRARHPVLILRGVPVVGNDLALGPDHPALVLSGPNAGGKTVSLKTIALCALLVRIGCFVPAEAGSRIDRFDTVLAAIGDVQSVQGDLSSFSGHLLVLGEMLGRAQPGALLLLDEIASGTDPAQGAALAQAVLERLLTRGPRVVVTTHFARLKVLPLTDPRFAAAAVEIRDGQPTYRVVGGALGESHALQIALRMGLPVDLVDRARSLLGDGERGLADALEGLDRARMDADRARRDAEDRAQALIGREAEVARREEAVRTRARELEERAAAGFLDRLAGAEKAIAAVIADLQRNPSPQKAEAARRTAAALRDIVPAVPDFDVTTSDIELGHRVRVKGVGTVGEVVGMSADDAQVRSGALTVRVPKSRLERVHEDGATAPVTRAPATAPVSRPRRVAALAEAVRFPGNTLDLRGQRVDEGLAAIEAFMDQALRSGRDHIFILHGHGTGAMKQAIRQWLPRAAGIESWAPANAEQGGDAYTVARLSG
jgi:DNA mismatch repair protein MutS2